MSIWKKNIQLDALNQANKNTAAEQLGIEFIAFGDDWLEATLTVDQRNCQPMGLLHGGSSALLAETVGSYAGFCACEEDKGVVGVEINANHLRAMKLGERVVARATPLHIGRTLHVWQINITDSQQRLCCQSRLTLAVLDQKEK
ncbi:PaaI family thioesterase [Gallibacterium trehalosifermentans]|uniref:PaaI family thioesterase n=1 Tax=Gallibacterium trehalosifermentans TaxID=516935 RepID=A0ABV6GYV9_9PAST